MWTSQNNSFPTDLTSCFSSSLSTSCILKGAQFAVSMILMFASIRELVQQFLLYKFQKRWQYPILTLMTTALLCNLLSCLWTSLPMFLLMFFYVNSLYCLFVVGFILFKYFDKIGHPTTKLLLVMGVVALTYTGLVIAEIVEVDSSGGLQLGMWLNGVSLLVCGVGMVVLGKNERQEKKVMSQYKLPGQHLHNPASRLWTWMGLNTCGQFLHFLLFLLPISQPDTILCCMQITSLLFTYLITLWYYRGIRRHYSHQPSQLSDSSHFEVLMCE